MERHKGPCPSQQELLAKARGHLMRISELARSVAEALAIGDEDRAAELDKQIDLELGMKERAMGAIHQHRKDHGC